MSRVIEHSSTSLSDDALLEIFEYLDGKDLVNCQVVCHQWRWVIGTGALWRKLIHRLANSPTPWARVWTKMALDKETLDLVHYKTIYKAMFKYFQQLDAHWRTGNYKSKFIDLPDRDIFGYLIVDDHYFAYRYEVTRAIAFVDRQSLKVTKYSNLLSFDDDILICTDQLQQDIRILNRHTDELINVVSGQVGWRIDNCLYGNKLLVVITSSRTQKLFRLSFWRIEKPTKITFLKEWTSYQLLSILSTSVDDYIACYSMELYPFLVKRTTTVLFFSTKTFEIERSLSFKFRTKFFQLHVENLFIFEDRSGHFRVMDIAPGTYLRTCHLPGSYQIFINSKYFSYLSGGLMTIYDRQNFLKPNVDLSTALLGTFPIESPVQHAVMDETEMICLVKDHQSDSSKVLVMDFGFHFPEFLSLKALKQSMGST